jgi:hypothetical protein
MEYNLRKKGKRRKLNKKVSLIIFYGEEIQKGQVRSELLEWGEGDIFHRRGYSQDQYSTAPLLLCRHYCKPTAVAVSKDTNTFFVSDGYCNSRVIKVKTI